MVLRKACTCLFIFISLWLKSTGESVSRTFLSVNGGSAQQYAGGISDGSKSFERDVDDDITVSQEDIESAEHEAMVGESSIKKDNSMDDDAADADDDEKKAEKEAMAGEDGAKHEEKTEDITNHQVEVDDEDKDKKGDVTEKEIENAEQDALAKHEDTTVKEGKAVETRGMSTSENGHSEDVSVSEQEVRVAEAEATGKKSATGKKASAEDVADQAEQDLEEAMSEEERANVKEHGSSDSVASSGSSSKVSEQVEQEEGDEEQEAEEGSDAAAAKSRIRQADESQTEEDSEEDRNNVPEAHHSSKRIATKASGTRQHGRKNSDEHSSKMRRTSKAKVTITNHHKAEHQVRPLHRKVETGRSDRSKTLEHDHLHKRIPASNDANMVSVGAHPGTANSKHVHTVKGGPVVQVDQLSSFEHHLKEDQRERQMSKDGNDDVRVIPTLKLKKLLDAMKTYKSIARKQALRIRTLESMVVETKQALRIEQLEVKLKEAKAAKVKSMQLKEAKEAKVKSTPVVAIAEAKPMPKSVDKILVRADVADRSKPRDVFQNVTAVQPVHNQSQSQKRFAQAKVAEGVVKSLVGTKVQRMSVNATEMPWSRDIVGVVVSDEDVDAAEKDALT